VDNKKNFLILGDDARQAHLARILEGDGLPVTRCLRDADYIILPPVARDSISLDEVADIKYAAVIFCGIIPTWMREQFVGRGAKIVNYLECETFAIANVIPTVEGALAVAVTETERTIFAANAAVLGYGRIGRILSERLETFGANVKVFSAPEEEIMWARTSSHNALPLGRLGKHFPEFDIIFNTIPDRVIDEDLLCKAKKNVLVIDLASAPGGVNFKEASRLGVRVIHALSLPCKFSPYTAAEILKNAVLNVLEAKDRRADYAV
jgi:dipicolinate synthase subunit A